MRFYYIVLILLFSSIILIKCNPGEEKLGELMGGYHVYFMENNKEAWGLSIKKNGYEIYKQKNPVNFEFNHEGKIESISQAYNNILIKDDKVSCSASVVWKSSIIHVNDVWTIEGNDLLLSRSVKIEGSEEGGFMSSISLLGTKIINRDSMLFFAPGMIYGDPSNLSRNAIGGLETETTIQIREDRLPAPLFASMFKNGETICIFNPDPKGNTTQEDSEDSEAKTLIDNRFKFGSLGVNWKENQTFQIGFWYPGSEGEITYAGNTYPNGQMKAWRMRYHALKNGFEQNYRLIFRLTSDEDNFFNFYTSTWRWAWEKLNPKLYRQNIPEIKQILLDMLGERAVSKDGRTGFPQSIMGANYEPYKYENKATLGFVGKNLEAAYFLLVDAQERENTSIGIKHRKLANDIINTFTKLPVAPPVSEGYDLDNGKPRYFGEGKGFSTFFLRSYGDDIKSLLKAVKFERAKGREHTDWLNWAQSFGDWLLKQQNPEGGFPRAWSGITGEVLDPSTKTSYNPIPMFLLLKELTGENKYMNGALKAGEYVWSQGQKDGLFVGATIDNPDVIDKEAGTLSCEAYLALYEATKDKKWIERASKAADYAETWIYLWEVPPPDDNKDHTIGLKDGMTTIGNQLISTGHSLTDNYMAFDVDEYVKLYRLTGDKHYLKVAKILLHNTKSWISTPGHPYDMKGYGWQQEHWSLAPHRGHGMHRRWLPWVTTSHLNGIFGLQDIGEDINLDFNE
jgi:hypothetical protein